MRQDHLDKRTIHKAKQTLESLRHQLALGKCSLAKEIVPKGLEELTGSTRQWFTKIGAEEFTNLNLLWHDPERRHEVTVAVVERALVSLVDLPPEEIVRELEKAERQGASEAEERLGQKLNAVTELNASLERDSINQAARIQMDNEFDKLREKAKGLELELSAANDEITRLKDVIGELSAADQSKSKALQAALMPTSIKTVKKS